MKMFPKLVIVVKPKALLNLNIHEKLVSIPQLSAK
jgi:hypothetical protein